MDLSKCTRVARSFAAVALLSGCGSGPDPDVPPVAPAAPATEFSLRDEPQTARPPPPAVPRIDGNPVSERLLLVPETVTGQRARHRVQQIDTSAMNVELDDRTATYRARRELDLVAVVTVLDLQRGRPTAFRIDFEHVEERRTGHVPDDEPAATGDPIAHSSWTCAGPDGDWRCVTSDGRPSRDPPRWLSFGLRSVLPSTAVRVGDAWTRGPESAAAFSLPRAEDLLTTGTLTDARAAEPDRPFATLLFRVAGTTLEPVYNEPRKAVIDGTAHVTVDVQARRITHFDARWTRTTEGDATLQRSPFRFSRRTSSWVSTAIEWLPEQPAEDPDDGSGAPPHAGGEAPTDSPAAEATGDP